jgi:hypothetical protein
MNTNKDKTVNKFRQAIAGVEKHFASTPTLAVAGTPMTPKDIVASLQGVIDVIDRTGTTGKAFHDAVAAQRAALAKGNAFLKALKMLVQNQLGSSQAVLGDFGFQIPTRQRPTEETKAVAVVKRAATRVARGTKGKRQKAKIKGTVPQTTTTGSQPGAAPGGGTAPNKAT